MRSHDQFNTTIYSHNDRYRGIKKGRHVVFVNPDDIAELGLADGQYVDVRGVYDDGEERVVRKFRVVSYPTARGCAAAYYPEANVLVPLNHTAEGSNTPVSKAVIVRLEPSLDQTPDGAATAPARVASRLGTRTAEGRASPHHRTCPVPGPGELDITPHMPIPAPHRGACPSGCGPARMA